MQKSIFNIILLGDPAAGKGTQSLRLAKKYHLYNFDMGEELRRAAKNPTINKQFRLKEIMAAGHIAPTSLARKVLRNTIAKVPHSRGILFNGHPKMLGEAKIAARALVKRHKGPTFVIYLSVPMNEIEARIRLRKRGDDTITALKNRARYYRTNIASAVTFYKSQYPYMVISGLGTRSEVFARLVRRIDVFLHSND